MLLTFLSFNNLHRIKTTRSELPQKGKIVAENKKEKKLLPRNIDQPRSIDK